MAYQLPPPPYNSDAKVRAWLFEVYKRNQDLLDDDSTIQITGEVEAPAIISVNNAFELVATVNLPFVTKLDGGSPTSTYPLTPEPPWYGVYGGLAEGSVVVESSAIDWRDMQAIGRGSSVGEVCIVGVPVFGNDLAFATYNLRTAALTTVTSAFLASGVTSVDGIDCDRATGTYVVTRANVSGSDYLAYWSTDEGATWTQCSSPSTALHGQARVWFDSNHSLWYWSTGVTTFSSNDGKTFVQQQVIKENVGTSNMGRSYHYLHSGLFPGDTSAGFIGNPAERGMAFNPSSTTVPIPVAGSSEIWEWYDVTSGGLYTNPLSPNWDTGVMVYNDEIYVSTSKGHVIKSTDGAKGIGNWSDVSGLANELIDDGSDFNYMTVVNGVFWAAKSAGGTGAWWRYSTGGEPVGYGWVTDDTGPFTTTKLKTNNGGAQVYRDPLIALAWIGSDAAGTSWDIYFDESTA
jgi:hypothetical protein